MGGFRVPGYYPRGFDFVNISLAGLLNYVLPTRGGQFVYTANCEPGNAQRVCIQH